MRKDVDYGIYDRPGPKDDHGVGSTEESTVGEDLPLVPSEQMANQLTVDRPPIEDEEFVPGSVEELSRASKAVAQLVPADQVEFFYRSLHRLLDDCSDRSSDAAHAQLSTDPEEAQEKVEVSENFYRKIIKKTLMEVLSDDDIDELDAYRGRDYNTGGVDYFGDSSSDGKPQADIKSKSDGTVSLDQIAAQFGYSGASGVRQEIKRLTDRLKYFVTSVKEEDLNALVDYAAGEYVDTMLMANLVDQEDADFLRSNPSHTKQAQSFRFFFVASFIIPAYREVTRDSTRILNQEIEKLDIPANMHQTVFNQVTGASQKGTIAKKLASLAKAGKISKDEAFEYVKEIESSMPALMAATDKSDDLVQKSLDKWQSQSKARKIGVIRKAVETTGEG